MARAPQPKTQARAETGDPRDNVIEGQLVDITEAAIGAGAVTLSDLDASLAVALSQADLDQQIVTAHKYPRSIQKALDNITFLATLDTPSATECNYSLPRGRDPETGKPKAITGPSIRMAEIIASQWGNCRSQSRVVAVDRKEKFIEAEGTFHDLESNSATRSTVRRRISGKDGKLYNDDMIVVTGNAAASIALRNAILRGVPKPVWRQAYAKVQSVIAGDAVTIGSRRVELLAKFKADFKMSPRQVFAILGVAGEQDIGPDEIVVAAGFYTALRNNEVTPEDLLRDAAGNAPGAKTLADAHGPAAGQARAPVDGAGNAVPHDPETGEVEEAKPDAAFPGDKPREGHKLSPQTQAPASTGSETTTASSTDTSSGSTASGTTASSAEPEGGGAARPGEAYTLVGDGRTGDGRVQVYKDGGPFTVVSADGAKKYAMRHGHPEPVPEQDRESDQGDQGQGEDSESSDDSQGDPKEAGDMPGEIVAFMTACGAATSWRTIKAAWGALRKSDAYAGASEDAQLEAKQAAATAALDLIRSGADPAKVKDDPTLYLLWLSIAMPEDVMPVWQDVIESAAYGKMTQEQKDTLADATQAAVGEEL